MVYIINLDTTQTTAEILQTFSKITENNLITTINKILYKLNAIK